MESKVLQVVQADIIFSSYRGVSARGLGHCRIAMIASPAARFILEDWRLRCVAAEVDSR